MSTVRRLLRSLKPAAKTIMRSSPYRIASAALAPPEQIVANAIGFGPMIRDWLAYNRGDVPAGMRATLAGAFPMPADRLLSAGSAKGHYFHQDLWFARRVRDANPAVHWDVGSRIDGFVSHLLVFRRVNVLDVRDLDSNVEGLSFHRGDITELPFPDQSVESISSLHVVEHIGLGRYGDKVDPRGHITAMKELVRVVAPGGALYLGFPIGRQRVEFNAHRVLDPVEVLEWLTPLTLERFAAVDDAGDLVEPARPEDFRRAHYACGLYVLRRREVDSDPPVADG